MHGERYQTSLEKRSTVLIVGQINPVESMPPIAAISRHWSRPPTLGEPGSARLSPIERGVVFGLRGANICGSHSIKI
jgi:hypothetical protein